MKKNILLALVLGGCSSSSKDGGIWAFELPYDESYECAETITHNFTDGYTTETEDDGDWTSEESINLSPQLFFGQLETYGTGQAVLIIGNEVYPGIESATGWDFTWVGSTETSESNSHSSGYSFASTNISSSDVTISLSISGATATGTWAATDNSDRSWSESDTWENGVIGFSTGQIPAAQFLIYDFTKGKGKKQVTIEGAPLTNEFDLPECSGDCQLDVVSSCSGSVNFTATKAGFEDEDVYEYLDEANQPYGS